VAAATFSSDSKQIVVVGRDGTIYFWELRPAGSPDALPDERPLKELVALAQVLACGRIDENQERKALDPERMRSAWETMRSGKR
jgi:hypothetical protein